MIEVTFSVNLFGDIVGFKMVGHAGYDTKGRDIICSAMSSISQMALFGIVREYKNDVEYEFTDKKISCMLKRYSKHGDAKVFMLNSMSEYAKALKEQYPEYIAIDYEMG